jgi:hypothetical protein
MTFVYTIACKTEAKTDELRFKRGRNGKTGHYRLAGIAEIRV